MFETRLRLRCVKIFITINVSKNNLFIFQFLTFQCKSDGVILNPQQQHKILAQRHCKNTEKKTFGRKEGRKFICTVFVKYLCTLKQYLVHMYCCFFFTCYFKLYNITNSFEYNVGSLERLSFGTAKLEGYFITMTIYFSDNVCQTFLLAGRTRGQPALLYT